MADTDIRATLPGTCTIACDVRDDDPDWIYAHVPACQREYIGHLEIALADERAARQAAEGNMEHALATVGSFRRAIEDIFTAAEGSATDDGTIRFYTLTTGPLHKAIGMARGTDAGGKFIAQLAERDQQIAALRRVLGRLVSAHDKTGWRNGAATGNEITQAFAEGRALLAPPAGEDVVGFPCDACGHLIAEHHPKVGCFGESECACPMQYREATDQQQRGEAAP